MGFYPGQTLRLLYRAPFGDPIAIEVGDYVLSLRLDEARLVEMDELNV
jgi:ferrous iron transport protein A